MCWFTLNVMLYNLSYYLLSSNHHNNQVCKAIYLSLTFLTISLITMMSPLSLAFYDLNNNNISLCDHAIRTVNLNRILLFPLNTMTSPSVTILVAGRGGTGEVSPCFLRFPWARVNGRSCEYKLTINLIP